MPERIAKGLGQKLFAGATQEQVGIPGVNMEYTTSINNSASSINANNAKDRSAELAQIKDKFGLTRTPTYSEIKNYQSTGQWSDDLTKTALSTGQKVDNLAMNISTQNSTLGKDPAVDNIIASQYMKADDKKYESYVDKIGMETGIYADIQNLDSKVLDTYKILGMSDQDIFSRQDLSPEEKIAMSGQRKDIATNRITQLRKIQQAKQNEIKELADYEAKKAEAQQNAYKEALAYMKEVNESKKFELDVTKYKLDVTKAQGDIALKQGTFDLNVAKYELDRDKFIADNTGNYYSNFKISQNVGAKSPNTKDTGYNGGTPGIDFAMPVGTDVVAVAGGRVVQAWSNKDYGNQVIVEDSQGNQHMYSHLQDGLVNIGDDIKPGQVIAKSGNTGFSTGPHLDYRVKGTDGKWQDPNIYLNKKTSKSETNITNLDEYLNLRNNTPGGNIVNKIKPINVEQIIKDDIGRFELSDDEFKTITSMQGAQVSKKTVTLYKLEKFNNIIKDLSNDKLSNILETKISGAKNESEKLGFLQAAIYSGKLDSDYFKPGLFSDGAGYNMLQEYFGSNVDEKIAEIKTNFTAQGLIKSSNKNNDNVYRGESNTLSNFYQNY